MGTEKARDPFLALLDEHHELDELTGQLELRLKPETHPRMTRLSRREFIDAFRYYAVAWRRFPFILFGGSMFLWHSWTTQHEE